MATLEELRDLFSDDELRNKVTSATVIAAYDLMSGTPTANDRAYLYAVIQSPEQWGRLMLMCILADNEGAAVAAISGASDATIKTSVDSATPHLVSALAGA